MAAAGASLRPYLRLRGPLARGWLAAAPRSPEAIIAIYRQAAVGLHAAHKAGLVHRDVKPENILCGDDGCVRVTDFGLVAAFEGSPPARSSHLSPTTHSRS